MLSVEVGGSFLCKAGRRSVQGNVSSCPSYKGITILYNINNLFARLGTDYKIRNQWFFAILEAMTTD